MSKAEKPLLLLPLFAALILSAPICGATNPCDVSEKACDEWKKAQAEQAAKAAEALKPSPSVIPARACDADPSYCAQYQKTESAGQESFGANGQVKETLKKGQLPKQLGQGMAAQAAQEWGKSCSLAQELEISFVLTEGGKEHRFEFAGCKEEGRNDYLPPYTERYYKGPEGKSLTIVTEEGWSGPGGNEDGTSSEVIVYAKAGGSDNLGKIRNAKLASGEDIKATVAKAQAVLRGEPDYAQLKDCEDAVSKASSLYSLFRDDRNKPFLGFSAQSYYERSVPFSLVLLTEGAAYYYYESCDICADVDKCDLKTRKVTNVLHEHSVRCSDMAPFTKGQVAYDACSAR